MDDSTLDEMHAWIQRRLPVLAAAYATFLRISGIFPDDAYREDVIAFILRQEQGASDQDKEDFLALLTSMDSETGQRWQRALLRWYPVRDAAMRAILADAHAPQHSGWRGDDDRAILQYLLLQLSAAYMELRPSWDAPTTAAGLREPMPQLPKRAKPEDWYAWFDWYYGQPWSPGEQSARLKHMAQLTGRKYARVAEMHALYMADKR